MCASASVCVCVCVVSACDSVSDSAWSRWLFYFQFSFHFERVRTVQTRFSDRVNFPSVPLERFSSDPPSTSLPLWPRLLHRDLKLETSNKKKNARDSLAIKLNPNSFSEGDSACFARVCVCTVCVRMYVCVADKLA